MFSKMITFVRFVQYKSLNGLRVFLGVKFGFKVLLRVTELTFRNSGASVILSVIPISTMFQTLHYAFSSMENWY